METIQCQNPQCRQTIDVLPGLLMVICPHCGQWVELGGAGQGAGSSGPPGFPEAPSSGEPFSFDEGMPPAPSSFPDPARDPAGAGWQPEPFPPAGPSDVHHWGVPQRVVEPEPPDLLGSQASVQEEEKPAPVPKAWLTLPDGRHAPLKAGKQIIGRQGADILVVDNSVSRKHCVIEAGDDPSRPGKFHYLIADIGHDTGTSSTNGVFLSHRSLRLENHERLPLFDGTVITLGRVRLLFNSGEAL